MEARVMVFLAFLALVNFCSAAVYKVGDSAGWTIQGNVNYTAWSSHKKFRVGDVIHFEYNKDYHDVMEVKKAHYKACDGSSPLKVFKTGNDTIKITRAGHHFFICGVPGHCSIGQKVDIRVTKDDSASSSGTSTDSPTGTAPSSGSSTDSPTGTDTVKSPPKASGSAGIVGGLGFALLATIGTLVLV
ncbi:hypothetical protein LUZ60_010531 [Juncus effusus]|nr:hypothetical protein LUZ60_010531 [Juncus effusus]